MNLKKSINFFLGFSTAATTWLPVNSNYKTLNLAAQKNTPQSHYKIYQALTQMRKDSATLKDGETKIDVLNDNKVLAIVRKAQDESIILLINFSDSTSYTVDVSSHTPEATDVSVKLSSVGSGISWGYVA